MSWTGTGKRCDFLEEDFKYLRNKIDDLQAQLGKDQGWRGRHRIFFNQMGVAIVEKSDVFARLDRIEEKLDQMEQFHEIQQVTTPKQTTYRKKGKKTK